MPQVDSPNEIDTERESLSSSEEQLLQVSLERGLEDIGAERSDAVLQKLREYDDEIMRAAEIARAQFDQKFGGLNPKQNRFSVSRIASGYFGYDSWENAPSLSGGSVNDWLDSDTPDNLSSGASGFSGPAKVGDEAVHVILGIGSYHPSPKVATVDMEVNESPRTSIQTKWELTRTDAQIKWLDRAIILPENSLFAARLYADTGGEDFPYLAGLTFTESRASQIADPENMTDDTSSTSDNIVAHGI